VKNLAFALLLMFLWNSPEPEDSPRFDYLIRQNPLHRKYLPCNGSS
jgi:hypothetical protein